MEGYEATFHDHHAEHHVPELIAASVAAPPKRPGDPLDSDRDESNTRSSPESEAGDVSSRRRQNRRTPKRQRALSPTPDPEAPALQCLVVHEVFCRKRSREHVHHPLSAVFFDHPQLNAGDCRASPLRGHVRLQQSLNDYLDEHREVPMTVLRRYDCEQYHGLIRNDFEKRPMPHMEPPDVADVQPFYFVLREPGPLADPVSERIENLAQPLKDAMLALEKTDPAVFTGWSLPQHLVAPYVHFYNAREDINTLSGRVLDESSQEYTSALLDYVEVTFRDEYEEADDLFERGAITLKHLLKLFRSNEIVVSAQEGQLRGFLTTACHFGNDTVLLECTTWSYDGAFCRTKESLRVTWPAGPEDEIPITELNAYPLRYGEAGLREKLIARGNTFWSCRKRKFISYALPRPSFEIRTVNPRYMIDLEMYKELHGKGNSDNQPPEDDLTPELMAKDAPPSDTLAIQLPFDILGFGLQDKKWRKLLVEHIRPTNWNKTAFDRLVLDPDKKSLITAMVTEHVVSDTSADIIEGKGNGLIILLYGDPGTGKTLTAESVAELAEKPLYRVTSSDIGVEPEAVEKYIETVLYIGTMWKAVVVFDEWDVFLEQRSQAGLQRNALVSVFLRVLDYYDGILILISNRVGTFDEAFKSRVHLALHYPAIDEQGRQEIWRDAIRELNSRGVNASHEQLKTKIAVLAQHQLNGREIKNSIRTARQLASQAKEPLSYDHLKKAIKVAYGFETYAVDTNDSTTHEEFVKAQNIKSY
ncbi:P-loop containing nucleoside triphosphate hydrolase protein [Bombardia bombarda]|uniref:P-loop containing nucleoside triphosphate hydrolase protein n=1 Tax=Bombardia bombarda TaxID=252184 RepID=A0AA39TQ35_9PEZI|nr:P-loop containing nucleoside triphosphate hydrolase protein [Bombardia bombarda]